VVAGLEHIILCKHAFGVAARTRSGIPGPFIQTVRKAVVDLVAIGQEILWFRKPDSFCPNCPGGGPPVVRRRNHVSRLRQWVDKAVIFAGPFAVGRIFNLVSPIGPCLIAANTMSAA